MMFVPGNNPGMMADAHIYGPDSIMLDLEDSVTMAEKDTADSTIGNMTGFNCHAIPHLPVTKQNVALLTPHPGQGNPQKMTSGQKAWKIRLTATAYNSTMTAATPYSFASATMRRRTALIYFFKSAPCTGMLYQLSLFYPVPPLMPEVPLRS